ncbi:MAG: lipid-transfer protein [Deltaproteobacteria bacterium]|nr:lipid-transfer protein [Deltaproteobacteria bacterium]
MKEVAVLGIGMHPWGKWPEKKFVEYAKVAAENALQDAGLTWKDIQFIASGATMYSGTEGLMAGAALATEMGWTGIPVVNNLNACATGAYALDIARARILGGLSDVVLCIGADWAPKGFFAPTSNDPHDLDVLRFMMGITNPSYFALYAMRRMQTYGTTELDLAKVKVKNSRHGSQNPNARFQKVYTIEEVLNSPMVVSPLRLLELCSTSDGAAAMILTSMEYARKRQTDPVKIAAISTASPVYPDAIINVPQVSTDSTFSGEPQMSFQKSVAFRAYEEAGLGPEDMHCAEVYDLSSAYELDWYENIGLCKPGEAEKLLNDGDTSIGGRIPVNPSGGLGAFGEAPPAQAIAQACELVMQVRGTAGARQIEGARAGVTVNFGLLGNASSVIVKK